MGEEMNRRDESMSRRVLIEIEMPADLDKFSLPTGVNERLQFLLDRQDRRGYLTPAERMEAEGLVNLAELLSLLRLRAQRALAVHEAEGMLLRAKRSNHEPCEATPTERSKQEGSDLK